MARKTIQDINDRIRKGEAVVYTAQELKEMIRNGERITPETVDAVTTGTCGIMSGTAAILTIPVAEKGVFAKAQSVWLNGVPAHPGPCPNESLGIVDLVLYGTSYASSEYGGGQVFRDLVEGREVAVRVEADGNIFENNITLDDCSYAKLMTTRGSFKNYVSFLNGTKEVYNTIFSVTGMHGSHKEISISGCGEINPVENDPALAIIGMGTKILVNGGPGYVVSQGTRSSAAKPNLCVFADLKGMQAQYMGGFKTSKTPEVITSVAIPIPVTDETLPYLMVQDRDIELPIGEIHDRVPFTKGTYADAWQGTDHTIVYAGEKCPSCKVCFVERDCPTGAFSMKAGIDRTRCYNCGACISMCPSGAFSGKLGSMNVDGADVPITLRQSNRARARELCKDLRDRILRKEFYLSEKVDNI